MSLSEKEDAKQDPVSSTGPSDAPAAKVRKPVHRVPMLLRYFADIPRAFDNLRAQKTRTVLTALGIVFGVGSVIGMLAIGAGAQRGIAELHRTAGRAQRSDRIDPVGEPRGDAAAAALLARPDRARRADSGSEHRIAGDCSRRGALCIRRACCRSHRNRCRHLYGVRPSYAAIHNMRVAEGRFFTRARKSESARGVRAGRSRQGQPARLRSGGDGQVHQGQRHLAAKWWACWRRRSIETGGGGAGRGSQQPDLRPVQHLSISLLGP